MIPYSDFHRRLIAIPDCTDLDTYIAEESDSVPMDDAEQVIGLLTTIWNMAHDGLTIKSIAAAADMSCRALAIELGIPYRTVQDWGAGLREPPEWQLPLIAYAAISLHTRE